MADITKSISALTEVEAEARRHLIFFLSSLVEVEAVGTFQAGIYKVLSALIEMEAAGGKRILFFSKNDVLINIWNKEIQAN